MFINPLLFTALPVALLFIDLTSPRGLLFHLTARKLIQQHFLFTGSTSRPRLVYTAWIGLVMAITLVTWASLSWIFGLLFWVAGLWGGIIFLQTSLDRKLDGFQREFLRFIQILQSGYHLQKSLASLIPASIEKMEATLENRKASRNDRLKRKRATTAAPPATVQPGHPSRLRYFLRTVQTAIANNQDHVSAFRQAKARLIDGSGLQIKLINLFIGIISSIQDSGNAGRALQSLESRIESDLAIRQELQAATAGAKLQMAILVMVPPAVLFLFTYLMQEMVGEMFRSTTGQILVSIAACLTLGAVRLTQKILNINI